MHCRCLYLNSQRVKITLALNCVKRIPVLKNTYKVQLRKKHEDSFTTENTVKIIDNILKCDCALQIIKGMTCRHSLNVLNTVMRNLSVAE